jgi:hypothetical protein
MQKNLPFIAAVSAAVISLSLLTVSPAVSSTITYVTPTGATTSGGPVDASATFTTGTNSITVSLSNLQANITDVAQALSDLFFTYSGSNLSGQTLTSSSGQEINVASNGTFTLGATVATGWALSSPASNTLLLNDLGAAGPTHTLIGPPGAGNVYSNANGSIAGNGPHNPFLNQTEMFVISLLGITPSTTITSATFSFGTVAGINVPGVPSTVPLPGALPLFATGLGALALLRLRRKKAQGLAA